MNYYKLTNKSEVHYGLRLVDGLNVDPWQWNPSGRCQEGGIYFVSSEILACLSYPEGGAYWIRTVTLPEGEPVWTEDGPVKYKAHRLILGRRRRITPAVLKRLVREGALLHPNAATWAAENGYLDCLRYLNEIGAPINEWAATRAAINGHIDCLRYLNEIKAPIDSEAAGWAAAMGQVEAARIIKTWLEGKR
ncbi:ankyrin repeat domain-containing protein [Candidatus Pacearchaeota archaeon]|jgi:hypothetical protein|nr:ankyrin repeat domain-containing protein [Candidatus Pacearchaeota archaeon]